MIKKNKKLIGEWVLSTANLEFVFGGVLIGGGTFVSIFCGLMFIIAGLAGIIGPILNSSIY